MLQKRRKFLQRLGGLSAGAMALPAINALMIENVRAAAVGINHLLPEEAAQSEDFWFTVQQAYTSSPGVINLNNGGVSPQPLVVQDALDRYNRASNEGPAYYMWHVLDKGRETVRTKLAVLGGVSSEEIAICRNTTEALETVIYGLNLKGGEDEVLATHQEYPNMRNALRQRELREGIKTNYFNLPGPEASDEEIVNLYKKNITKNTKVLLVSHVVYLNGQILPVRDICDMAKAKGLRVIVDGAHAFAHLNFNIPDLNCDYYGTSLHKWLCAPFGTGMLYVKKDKINDLWPMFGMPEEADTADIRKFEFTGTRSFPIELAIGHAINFHNGIGTARKEARLRYLKTYWLDKMKNIPGFKLAVPAEPGRSCGLANFHIEGVELNDLKYYLLRKKQVYCVTTEMNGLRTLRVAPNIYTTIQDLDFFVDAVKAFKS